MTDAQPPGPGLPVQAPSLKMMIDPKSLSRMAAIVAQLRRESRAVFGPSAKEVYRTARGLGFALF